jgi:hypothetical protein
MNVLREYTHLARRLTEKDIIERAVRKKHRVSGMILIFAMVVLGLAAIASLLH